MKSHVGWLALSPILYVLDPHLSKKKKREERQKRETAPGRASSFPLKLGSLAVGGRGREKKRSEKMKKTWPRCPPPHPHSPREKGKKMKKKGRKDSGGGDRNNASTPFYYFHYTWLRKRGGRKREGGVPEGGKRAFLSSFISSRLLSSAFIEGEKKGEKTGGKKRKGWRLCIFPFSVQQPSLVREKEGGVKGMLNLPHALPTRLRCLGGKRGKGGK